MPPSARAASCAIRRRAQRAVAAGAGLDGGAGRLARARRHPLADRRRLRQPGVPAGGDPWRLNLPRSRSSGSARRATASPRLPDGGPRFVPFALPGERVRVVDDEMPEIVRRASPERRRADLPAFRHLRRLRRPAHERRALCRLEARHRRRGVPPARHDARVAPLLRVPPGSRRRAVLTCQARRREHHARLSRPPQPRPVRPRGVSGAGARASWPALPGLRAIAGLLPAERKPLHRAGDTRRPRCERGGKAPPRRRQSRCRLARIAARSRLRAHHGRAARRSSSGHRRCCRPPASASCRRPVPSCRRSPRPRTRWSPRPRAHRQAPSAPPTCSAASARSPWRWRAAAASRRSTATQAAIAALQAAVRHASGLKPIEARVRDLFREPLSPRELAPFDAVVLDPPRAGAKAQCEALATLEGAAASSTCPAIRPRWRAMRARWSTPATGSAQVTPIDQFLFSRPRRAGRGVHALMPSRSATPLNGPPTNICHLGVCWWGGWGTALLGEVLHACVGMAVHRAVLGERAPYAGRPRRPSARRPGHSAAAAAPRPGRVSGLTAHRIGTAKSERVSAPKSPRIARGSIVTRGRRRNRKSRQTPRPTLHPVPPRRSAPARHVWLEARASTGRTASAAIVLLAARAARTVTQPATIAAAAWHRPDRRRCP